MWIGGVCSLAAIAAAWPFRRVLFDPTFGRIELPPPARPTPRYVNIFNRVGRSYEVVQLDEDGRLPERFRHLEPSLLDRRNPSRDP